MTTPTDDPGIAEPDIAEPDIAEQRDAPDLLDADWVPRRRTNRLTVVLVVAIVAATGFIGGAFVHSKIGGPGGNLTSGDELFPGGGLPQPRPLGGADGPGMPGGGEASTTVGPDPAGAPPGSDPAAKPAAKPVVVGTVRSVTGTALVVENFAGKRVTVGVPKTATVTVSGLGGVSVGMTVSVVGTRTSATAVTAVTVTGTAGGAS